MPCEHTTDMPLNVTRRRLIFIYVVMFKLSDDLVTIEACEVSSAELVATISLSAVSSNWMKPVDASDLHWHRR